jgi:hypothetical protein
LKYLLLILLILTSANGVEAQILFKSYIDIGKNNTSGGVFIKNAYRSSYQYQKFNIDTGIQLDLLSNNPNTLTGFDIIGLREFSMRDFPFDVKGFFMLNRFSNFMHETNWGVRIETKKFEHFIFEMGTNFKTYSINSAAREEYNIEMSDSKLRENFNLLYLITAYLKPKDSDWNVGLSCTNVDHYIINQSTNPVFNLQMKYKLKSNLSLYMDTWYKQAGVFNINANYFGYFFRGGVIWQI